MLTGLRPFDLNERPLHLSLRWTLFPEFTTPREREKKKYYTYCYTHHTKRERYYTYPALRLIQDIPWQIPKMKQCHQYKEGQAYESTET